MDSDQARQVLREELGRNYHPKILRLLALLRRAPGLYNRSPVKGQLAFGDPVGDLIRVLEDLVARAEVVDRR